MKVILCTLAIVLLSVTLRTAPANADTDYRCLSNCIAIGTTSAAGCRQQCSYNVPLAGGAGKSTRNASVTNVPNGLAATHKVFNTPVPSEKLIDPKSSLSKKPAPSKDYACVQQCLNNGHAYKFCNLSCLKTTCAKGSPLCKDGIGATPGWASSPPAPEVPAAPPH